MNVICIALELYKISKNMNNNISNILLGITKQSCLKLLQRITLFFSK